jgi:hypothetical protein
MTEWITNQPLSDRERLQQLAMIFAARILRLRRQAPLSWKMAEENIAKPPTSCLEVGAETVLSVHSG